MEVSREEKIILSILGEQVELEPPQSRIEVLLYELKDAIEQGGGGSGGGSAEPFFFEVEIKGIDQESGNPIVEETSTTYDNLISMMADGRPIYCHLIAPPELADELGGEIETTSELYIAEHRYYPNDPSHQHLYIARFEGMVFEATSPNDTLASGISSGGGGGDDTPVT